MKTKSRKIGLITAISLVVGNAATASYALEIIESKFKTKGIGKNVILGMLGFSYSLLAIYGSGEDTVFCGFLLLLMGIPLYILMAWNKKRKQ